MNDSDVLRPLLRTLAESLDVRTIFARISEEAARVVPHELLMLGLLSDDRQQVRVMALSGDVPSTPARVSLPETLRLAVEEGAFVLSDVRLKADGLTIAALLSLSPAQETRPIEYPAQPFFRELLGKGLRSFLRVPVRLRGGVLGGLIFC